MGLIGNLFRLILFFLIGYIIYQAIAGFFRALSHGAARPAGGDGHQRRNERNSKTIELDKDQYKVE